MRHVDTGAPATSYIDMRTLASPKAALGACPVAGCIAQLGSVVSQRRSMPYCPAHRIRIHAKTFVYYHGEDRASKCDATLRNILFEPDYFRERILGNQAKAESYRMGYETSEDALTWNVFARLARTKQLSTLVHTLTGLAPTQEPELYLWGLKVALDDTAPPSIFPELIEARDTFEKGIKKFLTEPDIMLYVPGQVLVLIEAKFTSPNTIASDKAGDEISGVKPNSRNGLLQRYSPSALPTGALLAWEDAGIFYSQLYRNLVFAIYMADKLGVQWGLVGLVSQKQCQLKQSKPGFQDPTQFIHGMLEESARDRFLWYSWEQLYQDHVRSRPELADLAEYVYYKSANGERAFST